MDTTQSSDFIRRFLLNIKLAAHSDITILVFTSKLTDKVHVFKLKSDNTFNTSIISNASFKSFNVYNGNLFITTNDTLQKNVSCMKQILDDEYQSIITTVTRQFSQPDLGNGALLVSSSYIDADTLKAKLEAVNLTELFDSFRNLSETQTDSLAFDELTTNEFNESCFLQSKIALAITDDDGNILCANNALQDLTGYSCLKLQAGMNIDDVLIQPVDMKDYMDSSNVTSSKKFDEFLLSCKNHEEKYVKIITGELPGSRKKIVQFIDLTNVKARERAIAEKYELLTMINKINTGLNSNITMNDVLDSIVISLREMSDFDLMAIALSDPMVPSFRVYSFRSGHIADTGILKDAACSRLKQQISQLNDVETQASVGNNLLQAIDCKSNCNFGSSLVIKIETIDGAIGFIALFSELRNAYSDFHVNVLKGARGQIAISLMRAELYKNSARSLKLKQELQTFEDDIAKLNDSDAVLRHVSKTAARFIGAKFALIQKISDENFMPTKQAQSLRMNQKIQTVIDDRKPLILKNLYQYYSPQELKQIEMRSLSVFPMANDAKTESLLYLYFEKSRDLLECEIDFLQNLLKKASVALNRLIYIEKIESELEKYKKYIDNSADIMILTDSNGKIKFVNESGKHCLGYSNGFFMGKSIHSLMLNGSLQFSNLKSKLLSNGSSVTMNTELLCKSGKFIPVSWTFSTLKDKNDSIGFLGIGKDMTNEQNNKYEIEKKYEDLEQFILKMSHNLKSPIATQQGYLSLIEQDYLHKLDEEGRFYVERALKNVHHMESMINDLLYFLQYNRGRRTSENVDLNEMIQSIIDDTDINGNIYFSVPSELPFVFFDKDELKIIFSNIISNSVKYMGHNDHPRIEINYEIENGNYHFHISDNGIGIDKKCQPYIFDLFYRANGSNGIEGTGIGLALVKKIIEDHSGTVSVHSEPGKGTEIHFTIPANNILKEYVMN